MHGIQLPVFSLADTLIQVEYGGINFGDLYFRSGLYKFKELPAVLGAEAAGIIVSLPTDEDVLNNETYKKQNYVVGGKVVIVRPPLASWYILLLQTLTRPRLIFIGTSLEYTRRMFPFPGILSILFPVPSRLK